MRWPFAVLDIEATGLHRDSYPIEIGFARWRDIDAPIESWSSLVKPEPEWTYWSGSAELIHKITREELQTAPPVVDVANRLNAELAGCCVVCDGLAHDRRWLQTFFTAADVNPRFVLEAIYPYRNPGMAEWLGKFPKTPHRAREDALRLLRGLAYGLNRKPKRIKL